MGRPSDGLHRPCTLEVMTPTSPLPSPFPSPFALLPLSSRLGLAAAATLTLLSACSADPVGPGESCTSSADCAAGQSCIDGRCATPPDGGDTDSGADASLDTRPPTATVVSIAIDPPSASLVSTNGSMPTQAFTVTATLDDGSMVAATAPRFTIDALSVGNVDEGSGTFTANGVIGGQATITAAVAGAAGDVTATATVDVTLERTIVGADVPPDYEARFMGAPVTDDARRAQLVYPLDGAVMPQNVYPADIQWLTGVAGDLFRITLTKPNVVVTAYVLHGGATFQNDWLVDEAGWRSVAQTDPEDDATITVTRWEAATSEVIAGTSRSVRFARAALTGSVYYWDIAAGRVVRIDDGTATRDEIMPTPPVAVGGTRCVGCHTVSTSGRYMAGRLGGGENIGAVFDLTEDLTGDPPPTVFPLSTGTPNSQHWWFSSWSPDDSRMVISTNESTTRALRFMDPFAGTEVPVTGTLPTSATHPAWAPDNSAIAYVGGSNQWGGAFTVGHIDILPIDGPDAVGTAVRIHDSSTLAGSSPGGAADSYPTWTPDSGRIAFSHGSGTRSEDQNAALYIMNRDGSDVVRLDAATSAGNTDFQPRFSPFDSGGYFWLSYLSRRDYGNAGAGTQGLGYQQIWVTAISNSPTAGVDPSSTPYWLPGQATTSRNISAYWAPRACRPDGEACSVGSECCGGDCRPGADGALVCAPPPPDRCRVRNETCSTDEDCCDGLQCFANVCVEPPA